MKKLMMKSVLLAAVIALGVTSCKKTTQITTVDDVVTLTSQASTDMDKVAVYSNSATGDIYIDDEGIAPDFLVEDSDADNISAPSGGGVLDSMGMRDSCRGRIRQHSFIRCLHNLGLNPTQKDGIKGALKNYNQCKENAVKRARAIYAALQKEYKAKADSLIKLARAGSITKAQLETAMAKLRADFHAELRAKHIAEKLDLAMKNCFEQFLRKLKATLTDAQWKAFVDCHRRK